MCVCVCVCVCVCRFTLLPKDPQLCCILALDSFSLSRARARVLSCSRFLSRSLSLLLSLARLLVRWLAPSLACPQVQSERFGIGRLDDGSNDHIIENDLVSGVAVCLYVPEV